MIVIGSNFPHSVCSLHVKGRKRWLTSSSQKSKMMLMNMIVSTQHMLLQGR